MSIYNHDGQEVDILASDPNTVDLRIMDTGEVLHRYPRAELRADGGEVEIQAAIDGIPREPRPPWLRYTPKPHERKPTARKHHPWRRKGE